MHDQATAACLDVTARHFFGGEHHQMRFEFEFRQRASRGDDVGAER